MKQLSEYKISLIMMTIVFSLVIFMTLPAQADSIPNLPKRMFWSCYDVGGTGYTQASAIADAMSRKFGVKIRLLPSGTSIGRLLPVINEKVDLGFLASEVWASVEGIDDFAVYEWGPQDLRVILAKPNTFGIATTKTSGIKTLKDLKGRRLSYIPASSSISTKWDATLAFAGLTWNDVERVDFPSFGEAVKALKQGQSDAALVSASTTLLYELETTPKGLQWLEFPADDEEGWEQMLEVIPYFEPYSETVGAGMSKEDPKELVGYRFPMITVRTDTPSDKVYAIIKAIDESFELFKDTTPVMPLWDIPIAGHGPTEAPFHEGAIKYLKEKGVWTQKDESWNNKYLKRMKLLQEAWDQVLLEAENRKIKAKEFTGFWLERKKEILKQR
jgi:TRAP transporter TAXI family solute receptor